MKKLLIASTALVATTGYAVADVNFSGYGRFGMQYQEDRADNGSTGETFLDSRFRLNIDAGTETDTGIQFNARVRVQADDNADGTASEAGFNGARFEVETSGLRLRVGNISGAFDDGATVNFFGYEPGLVGTIGQYNTLGGSITGYSSTGQGVNGINLLYEIGDLALMASYNADHDPDNVGDPDALVPDPSDNTGSGFNENIEVGAKYTYAGYSFAAAYGNRQASDDSPDYDYVVVTLGGSLSFADFVVFIGEDEQIDEVAYGMSASFPVGASTKIIASVAAGGTAEVDGSGKEESYGVGVAHDLGAGASLLGFVGNSVNGDTVADLGVKFNF